MTLLNSLRRALSWLHLGALAVRLDRREPRQGPLFYRKRFLEQPSLARKKETSQWIRSK